MTPGFRTDIQALRGLAVSLVLLYHADLGFLPGGFLGVDIFFVISGFLITDMVRRAVERGSFRFAEFYFRRAKRLLPAAYVTFLLSALAAPFILNAQEQHDFTRQLIGSVTFTANMALYMQAGYFAGAADLKPLLHVWSLSIEEQYYLLLPAFLAFVPRKYWIPGGVVLLLSSIGLCLALLTVKPIATFYLLPMRAWELGLGSLVAIAPAWVERAAPLVARLFWPAVAVLLAVPVFPTGLPHPGVDALLVCVATTVVILRRHPLLDTSVVSRGLARVGDVSYSLYLAHWPPFAFLKNAAVAAPTMAHSLLTLALGIGLGLLLYRFVELPTRRLQLQPSRRLVVRGLATSAGLLCVPLVVAGTPGSGPDYAHIRRPNDGFSQNCVFETDFRPLPECRTAEQPKVLVWGDSFAMHLVPGVAASTDGGTVQATRGNCGPFVGLAPMSNVFYLRPWAESCLAFNRSVLDYVRGTPSLEVVVLASPFRQYLTPEDGKHHWRALATVDGTAVEREVSVELAADYLRQTVRTLRALGKRVVIVAPPPSAGFNIGSCMERREQGKLVIGAPLADCSVPLADYRRFHARSRELLARLNGEEGLQIVSFDALLCDDSRCKTRIGDQFLYIDVGHLTHEGSVLLAGKLGLRGILDGGAR